MQKPPGTERHRSVRRAGIYHAFARDVKAMVSFVNLKAYTQ